MLSCRIQGKSVRMYFRLFVYLYARLSPPLCSGWMDGQTDRQTDRQTDGCTLLYSLGHHSLWVCCSIAQHFYANLVSVHYDKHIEYKIKNCIFQVIQKKKVRKPMDNWICLSNMCFVFYLPSTARDNLSELSIVQSASSIPFWQFLTPSHLQYFFMHLLLSQPGPPQ